MTIKSQGGLNPNAEKWVQRLEKNDLPQTRGAGHDEKGYCCLMVACVVYEEETGNVLPRNIWGFYTWGTLGAPASRLSANKEEVTASFEDVKEWLGLRTAVGDYTARPGRDCSLIVLNDEEGLSFLQIASVIRSKPDGLFC